MKTNDSVKAIPLAITILYLFVTIFSYTTYKVNEQEYVSENTLALEENTIEPTAEIETVDIEKLSIPVEEKVKINIAEGVSQEERDKEALEAKKQEIVYENMTLGELSDKLDRSLNDTLSGQGLTFATLATDLGVDPYLAVAIVMHETGCKWTCSSAVNYKHNVGGMMGSNGLLEFNSLEEGIEAYMNNLYKNYVSQGLTTADAMASKYAASPTWASKVNTYINELKAA